MTVVIGGHLLLAPASIAAGAVATMLGLVLVRLAQQTASARALRTLVLVVGHADKWLHKRRAHAKAQRQRRRRCASSRWLHPWGGDSQEPLALTLGIIAHLVQRIGEESQRVLGALELVWVELLL